MAEVIVQLTRQDITKGKSCKADECAVALAVARASGRDPNDVCVGPGQITLWHESESEIEMCQISTTPKIRRLILLNDAIRSSFLRRLFLRPTSFPLDIPDRFVKGA